MATKAYLEAMATRIARRRHGRARAYQAATSGEVITVVVTDPGRGFVARDRWRVTDGSIRGIRPGRYWLDGTEVGAEAILEAAEEVFRAVGIHDRRLLDRYHESLYALLGNPSHDD